MSIIETKDLCLYYGEKQALKDINMKINKNEVTALIGPSGCGKSTYLRTINRMNDLIESVKITGEVLFEGKDIYKDYDEIHLRKRIGMVFQRPNPFPMSIYDNISYGPRIHGIKNKKVLDEIVEKSLKGAALWDETKDRLKESALGMSGGQQQRVAIARALIAKPDIIFADEPTGNLDSKSGSEVMNLLIKTSKQFGKTLVVITHDDRIAKLADRKISIIDGVLMEVK